LEELNRQKKVLNMMVTAHSILKDRYLKLSSIFENTLLFASVILNALVFVDSNLILKFTNLNDQQQRFIIGVSTILVFAISVILIQVKWKEKAENHSVAAGQYFLLLQECRGIINLPDGEDKMKTFEEFTKRYAQVSNILCKIPDKMFNSLKQKHYRKIEMSKLIDKHPGSIMLILRIKLFLSSFRKK
jgi:hypothetical protein